MIGHIWDVVLYQPLLNALAFLVSVVPGGDVGIAVIVLTILVKIVLFPLSQKSIKNQVAMNILAPELNKIKKSGVSKEEQARLTFELYKKHKTNPFSGCLLQIPILIIIIALYRVFFKGINFDGGMLYSFIHAPEHVNMLFLGMLDLTKKSIVLAVLAGISQFLQAYYMPKPVVSADGGASFQDNFAKSMNTQMKYVFPVVITFIAYGFSGAVALYWVTSNIFTVGQQIYVNKTEKKVLTEEAETISHTK